MTTHEERLSYNEANIAEFRETGGKVASFGDAPLLLLTTIGAKSGEPRIAPMMYLADADDPNRVYVFGSNGGRDTDPAWVVNVREKADDLTVEIGTETVGADAEILEGPERDRIYAIQSERYSAFADYQAGTDRVIPVVALNLHRS
jgi:deazaflavin-dependent oxidoreductase (nitroreductase family)